MTPPNPQRALDRPLPDAAAMDVLGRLVRLGGAARYHQLVATASDRRALSRLVGSGEVERRTGCYTVPGAPVWLVRARQYNGALTCASWAQLHEIALLAPPREVHLAVPANRSPKPSRLRRGRSVVLHRTRSVSPSLTSSPRPLVEPTDAAVCLLRCMDLLPAVVAVDSLLNRGLAHADRIAEALLGPGSARAASALRLCNPRSQSLLESIARVYLELAGIRTVANPRIPSVGRVDLLAEGRVVIELDGFEHHGTRRAFAEDRRRDRELVALGYRALRFTYDDVVHRPEELVASVRAALSAPALPVLTSP